MDSRIVPHERQWGIITRLRTYLFEGLTDCLGVEAALAKVPVDHTSCRTDAAKDHYRFGTSPASRLHYRLPYRTPVDSLVVPVHRKETLISLEQLVARILKLPDPGLKLCYSLPLSLCRWQFGASKPGAHLLPRDADFPVDLPELINRDIKIPLLVEGLSPSS